MIRRPPRSTLFSLHDALPICGKRMAQTHSGGRAGWAWAGSAATASTSRSEEHTSELQSPDHLVCRLLLEKKKERESSQIGDALDTAGAQDPLPRLIHPHAVDS